MKKICLLITFLFSLVSFAGAFKLPASKVSKYLLAESGTGFVSTGITVAGGNGQGSSGNQLQYPEGIFIDRAGNVYVADGANFRVQKWTPGALTGITVAGGPGDGSAASQLNQPSDVFVDLAGNVYVADKNNHRVQKWAPGASAGITVAGGYGPGSAPNQLHFPGSIFVDPAGNVYVGDLFNARIQKWAPGASTGTTVAGGYGTGAASNQLSGPSAVFVDPAGNIYISDGNNYRIQKWAPGASSGITVAGGNGYGPAANQFLSTDIFVDLAGNMYITDVHRNRIQKWPPGATEAITVAGGSFPGSAADQFFFPGSVFLDPAGNMYVSDGRNHRVQKFLTDQLTTCLPDLIFTAPSCNATATIRWSVRPDTFPATIDIPEELDLLRGKLYYMGALNGHGYYKSSLAYPWPVAKDISFYIGDTSVNGHLVTINSSAENNFIFNQVKGSGYAPWIGLYNSGKPGRFGWVTGETLAFSNWAANEPSNAAGNARYVKEPYVRFLDNNGAWNDQRSDNVPFIAEFDEPLLRFRQISGPANGSPQRTGVYRICYETTNLVTDERDTCCFNVTVNCASSAATDIPSNATVAGSDKNAVSATNGRLSITTSPNPSSNYFSLTVTATRHENNVEVRVTDVLGNIVESKKGIMPGQTLKIGANYRPGIYFAQVIQGGQKAMVRIVKQ